MTKEYRDRPRATLDLGLDRDRNGIGHVCEFAIAERQLAVVNRRAPAPHSRHLRKTIADR